MVVTESATESFFSKESGLFCKMAVTEFGFSNVRSFPGITMTELEAGSVTESVFILRL